MVRLNKNRSKLLLGCGSAALAVGLAAMPHAASAQAIQASDTTVSGSITRSIETSGSETITVNTPTAVVNWTPIEDQGGNALDYLPTGNTVTFENSPNITDFAILNRILPSTNGNIVVFDGTVISQLIDPNTGSLIGPGGTVAFYSPTGIFVGGNAVFDVGNLILTTLDPDLASFDDFALNGGQLQMFGQTGTTAQIIFAPGSQVIASAENSFFAVTAAEIQFFGSSNVNGSTAFIGGEQVNVTVSNGLFDIQIPVGSSSPVPIQIDGDVGGPSSTGTGDNHLIYAVAAAQTDPISLLFSGNLGFAPAASAGVVNGEIILSANYEVSGRSVDGGSVNGGINQVFAGNSEVTDVAGSIFMNDFISTSSILAIANEEVQVTAFQGPSSIDGNLLMVGRNFSELTASNGQIFDITGDVLVSSRRFGLTGSLDGDIDANAQGGQAFIDAFDGGQLTIDGNAFVTAEAFSGFNSNTGYAGSAQGGTASIASNNGSLTITGEATVLAGADGYPLSGVLTAGDVRGGTAQMFVTQNGQVTILGDVLMGTDGIGSDSDLSPGAIGGNGFGGFTVLQSFDAGTITLAGNVELTSSGFGGESNFAGTGAVGDAGDVSIFIANTGTIDIGQDVVLTAFGLGGQNRGGRGGDGLGGAARGFVPGGGTLLIGGGFETTSQARGGLGNSGGDAFGGIAGIQVLEGTVDIGTFAVADTTAVGGNAFFGFGGTGGNAEGGNSFFQADGTAQGGIANFSIGGFVDLVTDAFGGIGGNGDGDGIEAGAGGNGIAGGQANSVNQADPNFGTGAFMLTDRDNAIYSVGGEIFASAQGTGGAGGDGGIGQNGADGGDGVGGFVQVGQATLSGTTTFGDSIATADFGDVFITTNGVGGNGGFGNGTGTIRGNGGDGFGGGAFFSAREGDVTAQAVTVNADGAGGEGHVGGAGEGGVARATGGATGTMTMASVQAFAVGRGGFGDNAGGAGTGGIAGLFFSPDGLTMDIAGDVFLDAGALGGLATVGVGGSATGGNASIAINDDISALTIGGNATLIAAATAADGNTTGAGAVADAGAAAVTIAGLGTIDIVGSVDLNVNAVAGNNLGSGDGGQAIAGVGVLDVSLGGALAIGGNFNSQAQGIGGSGGNGGEGFGGFAAARVIVGSIDIGGAGTVDATGRGGNANGFGGVGGIGRGGLAAFQAEGTQTETASLSIGGLANGFANAFGGTGGASDGGLIAAGRGGDAFAGSEFDANVNDDGFNNGAYILVGGDNGSVTIGGTANIGANAFGGDGGAGGSSTPGGDGGNGFGGSSVAGATLFGTDGSVGAGTLDFANLLRVGASGSGGAGGSSGGGLLGDGGDGTGGRALVGARAGTVSGGDVVVFANGIGGTGENGGDGTGGSRAGIFMAQGGAYSINNFSGFANGVGGSGASLGGFGLGGQAFAGFQDGTGLIAGNATVDASGTGGASGNGDGGEGIGGVANISIFNQLAGNGTVGGFAQVLANGIGGDASSGFTGGTGTGGEAFVQVQAGGSITLGSAQVVASGQGGSGTGAIGGDGFGGLAELIAIDAGSSLSIINETPTSLGGLSQSRSLLAANGVGGTTSGGTGLGGTGTGGDAIVTVTSGAVMTLPQVSNGFDNRITARGAGGQSLVDGGTGGTGIGGTAIIGVDGGTLDAGRVLMSSFAPGGSSFDSSLNVNGGDGTGGDRQVNVINGGELTIELSGGTAGGSGGQGSGTGDGGNGSGGTASLLVENSTVNFEGRSIIANQVGGGVGFNGGDATAGSATVTITNSTINLVDGAILLIGSDAFAGSGEGGSTARGGNAIGGTTTVDITGSTISTGTLSIRAVGLGGSGFDSLPGQGGSATGGTVSVNVADSILSLRTAEDTVGFVIDPVTGQQVQQTLPGQLNSITAEAAGGDGLAGGDATSGSVTVNLINTDLSISPSTTQDGILQVSVDATGGDGITQGGDGLASDLTLQLTGSTVTGGVLQVLGSGRGGTAESVGGLGRGAEVFVVGTESDIGLQGEFLIAAEGFGGGGDTGGDALGGVASLDLSATNVAMTQDAEGIARILIESSGNAGEGAVQMGNASAGLSQLLMLDSSISSLDLFLASEAEAASASTGVLGGNAAGGEIEAIIEGSSVMDVGNFFLAAPGVSGPGGTASGGFVGLFVGGPSGAPDLQVDQVDLDASANGGDTNTAGQFVVDLRSGQLAVNSLFAEALGDFGSPAMGISSISALGGSLPVTGSLGVNVTDDFDIEFGQGSIIGGPTISDPTASVSIISQGTISIIGDDDNFIGFGGLNMNLVSRDIDIEEGARFGAGNLVLRSLNTDDPAIIGGDSGSNSPGPGEGYVLSQEEAGRIEVGEFLFIQPLVAEAGPNDPDIIIRDITAFGSLDDGAQSITVTTDGDQPGGIIRVEGVVVFQDASSTDRFSLFAPGGRIEVVTPGGIGVVGSTGNPSGNLFLGADQIWIADSDMIALLQSDPFFSGRNDQLAVAVSGSEDPLGYLRGGSVSLEIGSQLLVRNTGTTSEQGGILVGDGGLSIRGNVEGSIDVFAYGARLDSSGNLVTGEAFYEEVMFNNESGSSFFTSYTDDSEFNDCLINTNECATIVDPEPEPPTNEESGDPAVVSINNPAVIEAAISAVQPVETSEQESDSEFGIDFPGLVEAEDVDELVDIEDPVASGGDSSLYIFGGIVQVEDDDDEDEDEEENEGSDD